MVVEMECAIGMSNNTVSSRLWEMPPDIAALGMTLLEPDNPYRHLGETVYPTLHNTYSEAFAHIPVPQGLTPVGLIIVLVLQAIEQCTVGQAGYLLKIDIRWKYALRLPLAYSGCAGRDLCTFHKRIQIAKPPLTEQVSAIDAAVRQLFTTD